MPRVTGNVASKARRKKVLDKAKGFYGGRSKQIRTAHDAVDKAKSHAYTGRKQKKRQYRRLWTVRINAACRLAGTNYSQFINGLTKLNIELNRKILAEIATNDVNAFNALVEKTKAV